MSVESAQGAVVDSALDVIDTITHDGRVFVSLDGLEACHRAALRGIDRYLAERGPDVSDRLLGHVAGQVDALALELVTLRALREREQMRSLPECAS